MLSPLAISKIESIVNHVMRQIKIENEKTRRNNIKIALIHKDITVTTEVLDVILET